MPVNARTMTVSVLVDGKPLPTYKDPQGQHYVAAVFGAVYTLQVTNKTAGRVEIVSSVDGKDVLDNQPADLSRRGYLVDPYEILEIDGWRINDDETADFVFSDPFASVAQATTGSSQNTGIFGFALYTENVPPPQPVGYDSPTRQVFGAAKSATMESTGDMGTAMGEVKDSQVTRVRFRRNRSASEVVTLRYASHDWLMSRGIIQIPTPNAFPGRQNRTGYDRLQR